VSAAAAQTYVSNIVSDTIEPDDQAVTYLLEDGTLTSDAVVAEASDQLADAMAFEVTRLGKVVSRLLEKRCTVRIWWPAQTGDLPRFDVRSEPDRFLALLIDRLSTGADLNCMYDPR
jgi:hypothetical protein